MDDGMTDPVYLDYKRHHPGRTRVADAIDPTCACWQPLVCHVWRPTYPGAVAIARAQVAQLIGALPDPRSSPAVPPRVTTWPCSAWPGGCAKHGRHLVTSAVGAPGGRRAHGAPSPPRAGVTVPG